MIRVVRFVLMVITLAGPLSLLGQEAQSRHYSQSQVAALPVWSVAEPDLTIGVAEGPQQYQLFRPGSIQVSQDGGISVINGGTAQVRIYGPTGEHLRSLGGSGRGPGEFVQLTKLFRYGSDSLVTWDVAQRRGPIYSIDGRYGRQLDPPPDVPFPWVEGGFSDGSFLLASLTFQAAQGGLQEQVITFLRTDPNGKVTRSLATVPSYRMARIPGTSGSTNVLFSGTGLGMAGGSHFWTTDGESPRVRRFDREGVLLSETSWATEDRRVSDEDVEAYWRQRDAGEVRGGPPAVARRPNWPRADRFPPTDRGFVDLEGRAWIMEYPRPSVNGERWLIFGPGGRLIARARMPNGFSVRDADATHVYGIARDQLDVERVERRRIRSSS